MDVQKTYKLNISEKEKEVLNDFRVLLKQICDGTDCNDCPLNNTVCDRLSYDSPDEIVNKIIDTLLTMEK